MSRTLSLRVRSVRRETPSTRLVRLDLNGTPFEYRAGQAALIGPHGHPVRKPYSMTGAPEDAAREGILEFLIKMDSAGEHGTHLTGLRRGSILEVDGPLGSFTFPENPSEGTLLFIAGGTGIAPIRAMLRHALAVHLPGRIRLVYSARDPAEFAFGREFRRLARAGSIELRETATRAEGTRWRGERGRLDLHRLAPFVDDPATLCFVCGPASLVEEVPRLLAQLGVAPERIRLEQW